MFQFEAAVQKANQLILEEFGDSHLDFTIVREIDGAIHVIAPDSAFPDSDQRVAFSERLQDAVGSNAARSKSILLAQSELISPEDIVDSESRFELGENGGTRVFLLDRLITNQDWIRPTIQRSYKTPIAVAFSIKGGVGRTTGLAVAAWHLAKLGKRVWVIDLDIEAPGIGSVLLDDPPDYGLVDWMVERIGDESAIPSIEQCHKDSRLAHDAVGSITVVPALGSKTTEYIAKIGRVFTNAFDSAGNLAGFSDRVNLFCQAISERSPAPDAILIDARAGMQDIGAALVTRLGAHVFMFARDDLQTWQAYKHLFQHLRHSREIFFGMPDADLRWKLHTVSAMADPTEIGAKRALDRSYETWLEILDSDVTTIDGAEEPRLFQVDDADSPHFLLPISFDTRVRGFDLSRAEERPEWSLIQATFSLFLNGVEKILFPEDAHLEL